METWLSFVILGEVLITLFILWGFMHEDKFILFEDKIIYNFKEYIKARRVYKAHKLIRKNRSNNSNNNNHNKIA